MSEYPLGSLEDREMLADIPLERFLDFFFLQIRNLWRVDGLYFLGIERKLGTQTAVEIDIEVWSDMAVIEAKSLKKLFKIGESPDISTLMACLRRSSWALDQPFKTIEISDKQAVLCVSKCRTQEARLRKGLGEFQCKNVRLTYLKGFARTLNSKAQVRCLVCPPDEHPKEYWCRWEFTI
ncbi:MAG: DUF6125 family protein [Candidatus Bathycorpusculaceae bacterium]